MGLSHQVPIDILVYSKPEYLKLSETNPWFAQEVEKKGIVIYETPVHLTRSDFDDELFNYNLPRIIFG
jgi:hypothetical protein